MEFRGRLAQERKADLELVKRARLEREELVAGKRARLEGEEKYWKECREHGSLRVYLNEVEDEVAVKVRGVLERIRGFVI